MSERQFHWQSLSRRGLAVDGCARPRASKDRVRFGWPWLLNRVILDSWSIESGEKC